MADDLATTSVLDPTIGFITHKTRANPIFPLSSNESNILNSQKALYIKALSANSKFIFQQCNRYTGDGDVGAKVVASVRICRHEILRDLCGRLCTVNESFLKPGVNDFFVVHSTYRKLTRLWLGPATFTNHDCESNADIYFLNNEFACVKATRVIQPGEEITVNYGRYFFPKDGCACVTCEKNGTGSFSTQQKLSVIFKIINCN